MEFSTETDRNIFLLRRRAQEIAPNREYAALRGGSREKPGGVCVAAPAKLPKGICHRGPREHRGGRKRKSNYGLHGYFLGVVEDDVLGWRAGMLMTNTGRLEMT